MATSYSTNLALALPVQGELSGTWGDTVNDNITKMLDEGLGYQAFSATGSSDTLTIPNGTTGVARSIYIQLNGTGGGTVNVPTTKTKMYFVFNNTASAITFKVTGQTGVSIPAAAKMALVSNGTDIIVAQNYFAALTLGAGLPVASGGTGLTAGTSGGVLAYTASGTLASSGALAQYGVVYGGGAGAAPAATAVGTATHVLTSNGAGVAPTFQAPATSGTVTAVSVASTNGFAGSSSGGATPALTLSTSITGVLKGNGTAISAATAGTDYVAPATATTFSATQTFSGSSSVLAMILNDTAEIATISATAATGTINYDITTQSVLYYTSNASANWTVNFRASSGTSLNTAMSTGQSVTVAFLVTQGSTAYYNSAVQVDGSSVTPKYQGGTAWAAGNASSIDVYMYTIIKTGNAAFTVFTSQTKFA